MEFYFPTEFGEQLAFGAAAAMVLIGAFVMFAPGIAMKLFGVQPRDGRPEGYSAVRSAGGLIAGFAGTALLLAQPMVYFALGSAVVLAAFGRVLSIMSDRGATVVNFLFLIVEIALAALPIIFFFGLV